MSRRRYVSSVRTAARRPKRDRVIRVGRSDPIACLRRGCNASRPSSPLEAGRRRAGVTRLTFYHKPSSIAARIARELRF